MYYLCDNEARASDIGEELGKDRSTVQRYLSKLRSAGLVERESVVKEGKKGRFYVYTVRDKEELKQKIENRLDAWKDEKLRVLEEI
jgi:predicted transcriptional regulator